MRQTIHTPFGPIGIMKDNDFDALCNFVKRNEVRGDHIKYQALDIPPMWATHSDELPISSYDVKYEVKALDSFRRMRNMRNDEIFHYGFRTLMENELIKTLNKINTKQITFVDKLSSSVVQKCCSKIIENSAADFGHGVMFTWIISDYRSVSIIFDSQDTTLYYNPQNTSGAIVFQERKLHLIYHNSTTNELMNEMADRMMYSPNYEHGGLMYDPSNHKYQTVIRNFNY